MRLRGVLLPVSFAAVACSSQDASTPAGAGGAATDGHAGAAATGGSASGGSGAAGGSSGSSGSDWSDGAAATAGSGGAAGATATGGTAGAIGDASDGPGVDPCEPIAGQTYASVPTVGPPSDRPAPDHADLNMKLRGWSPTGGTLGLVTIAGPTDALAPKLDTLFAGDRVPDFAANYRVNQWDWVTSSPGGPIEDWEVTLAGFAVSPGEVLELPRSGYEIAPGMGARVLFVDDDSITLKYTGEDNVVSGYTIHAVGLCVEPSLAALYATNDGAGRTELPALGPEQPFARARGSELLVAIRDTGAFMDPRSEKDWW
jgi:hypothetical protein